MKQNHTDSVRAKGVKFQTENNDSDEEASEASKTDNKSAVYNTVETAKSAAFKAFNECDSLYRVGTENDPFAKKTDTVAGILQILKKLQGIAG